MNLRVVRVCSKRQVPHSNLLRNVHHFNTLSSSGDVHGERVKLVLHGREPPTPNDARWQQ